MIIELENEQAVVHAAADGLAKPDQLPDPDDPRYQNDDQWGLRNKDFSLWDIEAPEAWAITTGDPSIGVGIIDGGFDSHRDLIDRIFGDPGHSDLEGWVNHGYRVACIVGANADNGTDCFVSASTGQGQGLN